MMHPVHNIIWDVFHYSVGDNPIPWGCSQRYGRELLPVVFEKAGYIEGAEVGVRLGNYSKQLCLANPKLHLSCIDPWEAYSNRYTKEKQDRIYTECMQNIFGLNVTVIRKRSLDAVQDFAIDSLDFVYIDANHSFDEAVQDIIHWTRRVRSGGIVACHDYFHGRTLGVVEAVDAYTRAHHIDPWYVTKEKEPTAYWVKQ